MIINIIQILDSIDSIDSVYYSIISILGGDYITVDLRNFIVLFRAETLAL